MGSRELEQGDVIRDLLLPKLPHERSFGFQRQGKGERKWFWKDPFPGIELLEQENKELRVMSQLQREPFSLVLSNSCDNDSGDEPILLVPIRPFQYPGSPAASVTKALADVVAALAPRCTAEGCSHIALRKRGNGSVVCDNCSVADGADGCDFTDLPHAVAIRAAHPMIKSSEQQERDRQADQWGAISRIATAANPKKFYMAGDQLRGIPRSEAHLLLAQPLQPAYLTKCFKELGATRTFGLSIEAVRHLQYTVSSFFGRNPRPDHDWPSEEDFRLKIVWLEQQIQRSDKRKDQYEEELVLIRSRLGL